MNGSIFPFNMAKKGQNLSPKTIAQVFAKV